MATLCKKKFSRFARGTDSRTVEHDREAEELEE